MHRTQNTTASPAPAVDISPATTLRGAALYLTRHGWTQDNYYADITQPFPAACVTGAIAMAAYGRTTPYPSHTNAPGVRDYRRAVDTLIDYLDSEGHPTDLDSDVVMPFSWNDDPDRTAEQITATLRAAADDYDWSHATPDDLETYADVCTWNEELPTRDGYLPWMRAR